MNCPGSVRLSRGMPSTSSAAADEGTEAHAVAASWLLLGEPPPEFDAEKQHGDLLWYIDGVRARLPTSNHPDNKFFVELQVEAPNVHPDARGTVDAGSWDAETGHLRVIDLKWGWRIVEARGNEQLLGYALLLAIQLGLDVKRLTVTIAQPRADHPEGLIRDWEVPLEEFRAFGWDVQIKAKATGATDSPLATGEWCRYCPAAAICPQRQEERRAIAKASFSVVLDAAALTPAEGEGDVDLEKLRESLDFIEQLEQVLERAKPVQQLALNRVIEGKPVPGWKGIAGRATKVWNDEVHTAAALTDPVDGFGLHQVDVMTTPKLRSPAQVEALVPKNQRAALEAHYHKRRGVKLVRDTDPRPAIKPRAADVFSIIDETIDDE